MLLVVPAGLNVLAAALGVIGIAAVGFVLYQLIFGPALKAQADRDAPPPEQGAVWEIIVDEKARQRVVSIGQIDSEVQTRMAGIKDDHIVLRFRKERDLEEYEIHLTPGGQVFYVAPHTKRAEVMKGPESFASRELIGYPAVMRLAAAVRDARPIQYLEFELATKYFINQFGTEKMKFILTLKKIVPGIDLKSRDRKGIYSFGRKAAAATEDAEEGGAA